MAGEEKKSKKSVRERERGKERKREREREREREGEYRTYSNMFVVNVVFNPFIFSPSVIRRAFP